MSSQFASYSNLTGAIATSRTDAQTGTIELFLGPYRSGKTKKMIDEIISTHRERPFSKTVVIVPSQRYQKVFEERLAKALAADASTLSSNPGTSGGVGLFSVSVMSFYTLVQKLLRQMGVALRLVPQAIRPQIIARVMSRLKQDGTLRNLKEHSGFSGIHHNLMDLIDEFERAALAPDEVLQRLEATAPSTSRFVELATIYKVYWQILDELQLMDERQAAFALVQALGSSAQELGFDHLIVDGFDRFNRLQLRVLSDVSARAKRTIVGFDFALHNGQPHPDYVWKETSYDLLKSQLQGKFVPVTFSPRDEHSSGREANTFRFVAPDRFFEMEEIARKVKRAILVEKVPAEEILVVVRNLRVYADAARAAFEDAGISHFIDEPEEVSRLPAIQFIKKLVRLELDGLARKDVLSCLRSAYLAEKAGFTTQEIEQIDRRSMDQHVVSGREQWKQLFESDAHSLDHEQAEKWWQPIGNKLLAFFDLLKPIGRATIAEHVRWVENILEHFFQPLFAERRGNARDAKDAKDVVDFTYRRFIEQKGLGEYRRCLAGLLLEESFLGDESLTALEFFTRLERLLARANFRSYPRSKGAVLVCGADLAPNRSFSRVFIGGLAEGEFPRKIGATGFVGPDEIKLWNSFRVDITNPRFHPGFETALFANLAARARDEIHLSYAAYESSGEELLPSFLINPDQTESPKPIDRLNPGHQALAAPTSSRNLLAGVLLSVPPFSRLEKSPEIFADAALGLFGKETAQLAAELKVNLDMIYGRLFLDRRSIFNGYLCHDVANGLLRVPLPRRFSATGLSDYGKCGFRYWISHVLKAEPAEEPRPGLDAKLLGEVCHKSLELFYSALSRNGGHITDAIESVQSLLDEAINQALDWLESRKTFRPTEFWHLERSEIRFRLHRFMQKERERAFKDKNSFMPYLLEAGFGLDSENSFPALQIKRGAESIEIRGRIDRIDKGQDASGRELLRLIDYKKGSTPMPAEDAYRGRNLQLPLYALAAGNAIETGAHVVEGRYLSIWSGGISGRLNFGHWEKLDEPGKRPILEVTEDAVFRFVDEMKSGRFSVEPNGLDVCQRCQHRVVCRISELKRTARGMASVEQGSAESSSAKLSPNSSESILSNSSENISPNSSESFSPNSSQSFSPNSPGPLE